MRVPAASLAIVFAAASGAAAAPLPRDAFAWRADVRGAHTNGGLYKIRVPGPVWDGSRAFPADLRIIDRSDAEWPFFIWRPEDGRVPLLRAEKVSEAWVDDEGRALEQVWRVQPRRRGAAPLLHDRMVVLADGEDFVRRVDVQVSDDGAAWRPAGQGYLVEQARGERISNRLVQYEPSSAPFLRIRLHPSTHRPDEAIVVRRVDVMPVLAEERAPEAWPLRARPPGPADLKTGVQTLVYDVGFQNVPMERLRLDIEEAEFARPLRVYGRATPTNEWRWAAAGGVHRMGGQVRTAVDLRDVSYRYLKVELFHYEEPPLTVTRASVDVAPVYLVFEAGAGGRPQLHFGALRHALPRYDLQSRTSDDDVAAAPAVELGRRERNPSRLARSLLSYGRWLGASAVVLVGVLGLAVLVNTLRRRLAD